MGSHAEIPYEIDDPGQEVLNIVELAVPQCLHWHAEIPDAVALTITTAVHERYIEWCKRIKDCVVSRKAIMQLRATKNRESAKRSRKAAAMRAKGMEQENAQLRARVADLEARLVGSL